MGFKFLYSNFSIDWLEDWKKIAGHFNDSFNIIIYGCIQMH